MTPDEAALASCAKAPIHPDAWFPLALPDPVVLAVCSACPVREACDADGEGEEHGVWGGRIPPARVRYERKRTA